MGTARVVSLEIMIPDKGPSLVRLGVRPAGREYVLWDSYHTIEHDMALTVAGWIGELHHQTLELMERATSYEG